MPRSSRWEQEDIEDGIGTVKILKWRYFMDYVHQELLDYETYVWRGQRNADWPLQSTLDRTIEKAKIAKTKRPDFRTEHLERFKFAARGRRGPNPPTVETESGWWALGQHHGLATPLLDWTASPFVAAYFAFISKGDPQTRTRAVYALHQPSIDFKVREIKRTKESVNAEQLKEMEDAGTAGLLAGSLLEMPVRPDIEFIRPYSDENQRLVNQGGLFTRAPDGENLEDWVMRQYKTDRRYRLIKFLIPNRDREECLKTLNRMNINHLTLFPDLYGASKFCNLFGDIQSY